MSRFHPPKWPVPSSVFATISIDFINGLNDAVVKAQPETNFGAYLNYVDPTLDAATAHELYYGDAVYGRLEALKSEVACPSTVAHEDHAARTPQPDTSMRCVPMTDSSRSAAPAPGT